MEENQPAGDPRCREPKNPPGDDYEYDEAHDVPGPWVELLRHIEVVLLEA